MIRRILPIFTIIVLITLFAACSSRQDVYISDTGKGSISIDVNLDDMVVQYSRDLLGGFSNNKAEDIKLFDIFKISKIVSELESAVLTDINTDSSNSLHIELDFQDPGKILGTPVSLRTPDVIRFSTKVSGNTVRKKLRFFLSIDNFSTVTALVGMKDSEIIETFGPQENPYSESEYLDLIEFLFEEYETTYRIRSIVKSSEIIINLQVDGKIVECYGCTGSGSTVEIKIPLLDIVTLEEPIEIAVEWE